jgi:nucleoside-diphosphate-sugar epimerase
MNPVLIIGGSYFCGRVLVEELLAAKKYQIFVYNRGNVPLKMNGVVELIGDRRNSQQVQDVIPAEQWHAVVDFCAYDPADIKNLIRFLPGDICHYILISTTSVYVPSQKLSIQEDFPKLIGPQPELGEFSDYGFNKWLTECALTDECALQDIPFTILRPAIVYGPYNYAPREFRLFEAMDRNEIIVLPEDDPSFYSFIYVVDLARIILECMQKMQATNQAFNVCSEELISYGHLSRELEKLSQNSVRFIRKDIATIYREQIFMPFPPDQNLAYCGAALQKILDFTFTPFRQGLQDTHAYHRYVQSRQKA